MTRSAAKRSNASARLTARRAIADPIIMAGVLRNGAFTSELSRDFVNRKGWQRDDMNWPYLAAMLNHVHRQEFGEGSVRPRRDASQAYPLLVANGEYRAPFERVVMMRPSRAERDFPIDGYSAQRGYYDQL